MLPLIIACLLLHATRCKAIDPEDDISGHTLTIRHRFQKPSWPINIAGLSRDQLEELVPSALSFVEPLKIPASGVILYSTSDKSNEKGFRKVTWERLVAMCQIHGYKLAVRPTSEDFKKLLFQGGHKYAPYWHKIFYMPELKRLYPDAKYFIWIDDDMLIPYPQSHLINYFVNLMESSSQLQWLLPEDFAGHQENLCTGFMIVRNDTWTFSHFLPRLIEHSTQYEDGKYITERLHEQAVLNQLRIKDNLHDQIGITPKARWPRFINSFMHELQWQHAMMHFAQTCSKNRLMLMKIVLDGIDPYMSELTKHINVPIQWIRPSTDKNEQQRIMKRVTEEMLDYARFPPEMRMDL